MSLEHKAFDRSEKIFNVKPRTEAYTSGDIIMYKYLEEMVIFDWPTKIKLGSTYLFGGFGDITFRLLVANYQRF